MYVQRPDQQARLMEQDAGAINTSFLDHVVATTSNGSLVELRNRLIVHSASDSLPLLVLEIEINESNLIEVLYRGLAYAVQRVAENSNLPGLPSVLNRKDDHIDTTLQIGNLMISPLRRSVSVDGKLIQLTPTEFDLLAILAQNFGLLVTRGRLLKDVWQYPEDTKTHTLNTYISRLREKLGATCNVAIKTYRSVGYCMTKAE